MDYIVFSPLSRYRPSSLACHHADAPSIITSANIFMLHLLMYCPAEGVFA
jgi:hypothetical protein